MMIEITFLRVKLAQKCPYKHLNQLGYILQQLQKSLFKDYMKIGNSKVDKTFKLLIIKCLLSKNFFKGSKNFANNFRRREKFDYKTSF